MRFGILGPLTVDGDTDVTSPQEIRLLAALLLHRNRPVGVGLLEEAVWGARVPTARRVSLQSKVSRLRARCGSDRIVWDSRGYRIVVGPGECDADDFRRLVTRALSSDSAAAEQRLGYLDEALGLVRGPLLGDLADEEFVGGEAVRFAQQELTAEEERLRLLLELGRSDRLLERADRLLRLHPYHERLCELQMLALAKTGRRVDALRAYQVFRRRLGDDIGIDPSTALTSLEQRLLDGVGEPARQSTGRSPSGPVPTAPRIRWGDGISTRPRFVGRETMLAQLRRVVLRGAGPRACVVTGHGGLGKTRVAMEVAAAARRVGVPTRTVRCRSGPLFAPLTDDVSVDYWANPDARARTVARLTRDLVTSFGQGVLIVEDLHDSDPGTLEVLTAYTSTLLERAADVIMVLSTRPLDLDQDRAAWLSTFARELPTLLVELDGLDEPGVFELIRQATGVAPTPEFSDVLHQRAGGNPLLALTGLEALRSAGDLWTNGRVVSTDAAQFRLVPADLTGMIHKLMNRLDQPAQEVLIDMALTIDGALDDAVIGVAAGKAARSRLAAAHALGLVVMSPSRGRVSFRHDLYRRAIAGDLTDDDLSARHADLFGRIVNAYGLASMTAVLDDLTDPVLMALAHHAELAGDSLDPLARCRVLSAAGVRALRRTDWPSAARWFRPVLVLLADLPVDAVEALEIRWQAGAALFRAHDPDVALPLLHDVARAAAAEHRIDIWGAALLDYCRGLSGLTKTRPKPPVELVEEFVAHGTTDRPDLASRLVSMLAGHHFATGDTATAHALNLRASQLARGSSTDPVLQVELAFTEGLAALGDLDLDVAEERFTTSVEIATSVASSWELSWGLGRLAFLAFIRDDPARAARFAEQARVVQVSAVSLSELSFTATLDAYLADLGHDDDLCHARIDEAERLLYRSGFSFTAQFLYPLVFTRTMHTGDADDLTRTVERWERAARVPGVFHALHLACTGRLDEARTRTWRPVTAELLGPGHLTLLAAQLEWVTRFDDPTLTEQSLTALYRLADHGVLRVPASPVSVASWIRRLTLERRGVEIV